MDISRIALVACIPLFLNACDSGDSSSDASENVPESSDASLPGSSCTLDRESTFDSVWVGANEKYGYYEYYECSAGKWKPVSLTYVICKNDSNAVGDTCVYERYEGVSKYCNTYIYSYKGNDEWDGVDTLSCWDYGFNHNANKECSLDTYAVGDTCTFESPITGKDSMSCVYDEHGMWKNCI